MPILILSAILAPWLLLAIALRTIISLFSAINSEHGSGDLLSGKQENGRLATEQQLQNTFHKLEDKMWNLRDVYREECKAISESTNPQIETMLREHVISFDEVKHDSLGRHFNPLTSSTTALSELRGSMESLEGIMNHMLPQSEGGKVEAAWGEYWEELEGAEEDLLRL